MSEGAGRPGRPGRAERPSQAGRPSGMPRPSSASQPRLSGVTGLLSAAERRRRLLITVLVVCLLAAALYHGRRWLTGSTTAPANLVGVWESSDARYAGRTLEFTADSVFFGGGMAVSARYAIRHVRTPVVSADATVMLITYTVDGTEHVMRVERDDDRTISLDGAHDVSWTRRMR